MTEPINDTVLIVRALRLQRKAKNLTAEDVANLLGVSHVTLRRWESPKGYTSVPAHMLEKWAVALDMGGITLRRAYTDRPEHIPALEVWPSPADMRDMKQDGTAIMRRYHPSWYDRE